LLGTLRLNTGRQNPVTICDLLNGKSFGESPNTAREVRAGLPLRALPGMENTAVIDRRYKR